MVTRSSMAAAVGVGAIGSLVKVLMWRLYRSTDFEVHRNWLAITNELPLTKWYHEDNSEWTLDYPPFFAYFEWILSQFAWMFDREMLVVSNLNYASKQTIAFQRLTVLLTDTVLLCGVVMYANGSWEDKGSCGEDGRRETQGLGRKRLVDRVVMGLVLIFLNPALFIVDHIHFQYNGFLMGVFIISIHCIRQDMCILGGILFAILLNLKHIFLYVAPLYFIYLLRRYCMHHYGSLSPKSSRIPKRFSMSLGFFSIDIANLFVLGVAVLSIFAASFGPFIVLGGVTEVRVILSRMFPFSGRGLCHAYWAPNFWALYNIVDKALELVLKACKIPVRSSGKSMTGGLVQDISHAVLPSIKPVYTFLLTLGAMSPILWRTWKDPDPRQFAWSVGLVALASFWFGWHVHEKAILTATLPLALGVVEAYCHPTDAKVDAKVDSKGAENSKVNAKVVNAKVVNAKVVNAKGAEDAKEVADGFTVYVWRLVAFMILNIVGNSSLLPLIFTRKETPIKICIVLSHTFAALSLALKSLSSHPTQASPNLNPSPLPSKPALPLLPFEIPLSHGAVRVVGGLYVLGLGLLQVFESVIQPMYLARFEFLPLLMWSVYSAVGIGVGSAIAMVV
ncbi:hypothetical protein AAMO2058_000176800 [Amorphochlora amoebiformis]